jgi:hypothetical protein
LDYEPTHLSIFKDLGGHGWHRKTPSGIRSQRYGTCIGPALELDELHKAWGDLSEAGSDATINATVDRFLQVTSDEFVEFKLNYTGLEPRLWALSLSGLLLSCSTMERVLCNDYDGA